MALTGKEKLYVSQGGGFQGIPLTEVEQYVAATLPLGGVGEAAGPLGPDGKLPTSQLPVGDVNYLGNWDAATNTPTLAAGVGVSGQLYICHEAGSQNLGNGVVAFAPGDWVIYDGTAWDRVEANGATPANPSVTVALAAKNGSAATFMRSDAAPALDVAIAPTWTGAHTFAQAITAAAINASGTIKSTAGVEGNTTVTAGIGSNSVQLAGAANGQDTKIQALGVTDANVSIQMEAKGSGLLKMVSPVTMASTLTVTGATTHNGAITSTGAIDVVIPANGNKIWLSKYTTGSGHNNAPTAPGADCNYLHIGGREYGNNGYSGIGFGYVADATQNPAVQIGHIETATASNTSGDFFVATRNSTSNVAPTVRLRVTAAGDSAFSGTLGVSAATTLPGPTNSGIALGGSPTWAMQSFYDQSNTANNRSADLLFISNSIKFRFANDARNAFLDVLSINGGQALGVTGITSTSGTGAWVHTGAFDSSGLRVKEGANAKQGVATLVAGTVTVNNTSVTANSRIFLTGQDNNAKGALRVSARTAATSFVITSSDNTDTGVVAYEIFEPGA